MVTIDDEHIRFSKLNRLALYRGIYTRVAQSLGIDRSFVSRVASGQRRSARVEDALLKEIQRIEKLAGKPPQKRKTGK